MPTSTFENLCLAVCELADLPGPTLRADPYGTAAFSMQLDGIVLSLFELPRDRGRRFFLLAEMGEPPPSAASAQWLALLAANAFFPGGDSLHFSRHPVSGAAIAHWPCRLDALTPVDVYQRLKRLQRIATQWQRGFAARAGWPRPPAPQAPASLAGEAPAGPAFHALCRQVHETLGLPPPADLPHFALQYRQVSATVLPVAAPATGGEFARVALRLDAPWDAADPRAVAWLLEANFALMSHPGGAVFCLVPGESPVQLQHVIALDRTDANGLLHEVALLAQVHAEWMRMAPAPTPAMRASEEVATWM